ncbi:MAG TPA: ABC transporter permease [Phototrophicaceae bacterium]|nr:ABC transporter permease [Phototrophicaceae bacterium]
MSKNRTWFQVVFAVAPIIVSLAITSALILTVNADPIAVFQSEWNGAFRSPTVFAGVINFWMPLALCSMGLIVTFTAGLWNIGVEGQIGMGAVFATWAALFVTLPQPAQIALEIALGFLGGALWGALVGFLKTQLGVHEIFGGVALNSLANVITIYLVTGPWSPPGGASKQSTAPFVTNALLPQISADFPVSLLMLILTFAAIIGVILILRGTRWGLQLKATGKNARSALLLGVPTTRSAISALMVCGGLAGIAGAFRVLFVYQSLRTLVSGGIGFLALLVVLLVAVRALWAPLIALIFALFLGGSTRLKIELGLDESLVGVLQGLIVLLVLLASGLRQRLSERDSGRGDLAGRPYEQPISAEQQEAVPHE